MHGIRRLAPAIALLAGACTCGEVPPSRFPSSHISRPVDGESLRGPNITVRGTAASASRERRLTKIEVSTDNGVNWRAATGTAEWTYEWNAVTDGAYRLRSRATDEENNTEKPGNGAGVVVDSAAPASTITLPADGTLTGGDIVIRGTAMDALSGVGRVDVSVTSGQWEPANGTEEWSFTFRPDADGDFHVRTRAVDRAGNEEVPGEGIHIEVDRRYPTSHINAPANGAVLRGGPVTVAGTAASARRTVVGVEITTDGGISWASASGTTSWTFAWTPDDGSHTLLSRARDDAGFVEVPAAGVTVTVDGAAPVSSVTAPQPNQSIGGTSILVTGVAGDGSGTGVALVEVSADGGLIWHHAVGTASWSWEWTLPADGAYRISSRATDAAGNVEAPGAGVPVRVVKTLPSSRILSPLDGDAVRGISYIVSGVAEATGWGVEQVEVSTDDGATWRLATGTEQWSFTWPLGAEGTYRLRSRATDNAGQIEQPAGSLRVTVDRTAPSSQLTQPPAGTLTATSVVIRGTASDALSGVARVEVSTDDGSTWTDALLDADGTFALPWAASGAPSFALRSRATDAAGNVETPGPARVVILDTGSPTSTLDAPTDGARFNTAPIAVSGTASDDSAVARVEVSFDGGLTWQDAQIAGGTPNWSFSWTPDADGRYLLTSRATDVAGNVEPPRPGVAVDFDRTPPTSFISVPADGAPLAGTGATVSGGASDNFSGVAKVEVTFDDGATWADAAPTGGAESWTYAWTLPADGTVRICSRATDVAGNVGAIVPGPFVKVDNTPPAASFTSPSPGAVVGGTVFVAGGTATDNVSGVATVEVSTDGGASWQPAGGTANWTFSWTLPADGLYTLLARARDAAGNVQATPSSADLRVDRTLPASAITDPADGAALKGTARTITGVASVQFRTLTRVEVSTDGGSTWSNANGTSSWTFAWSFGADAAYNLRTRATDSDGRVETPGAGVNVFVDNTAPAAAFTVPSAGAAIGGTAFTLRGTAADATSGVALVEVSTDGGAAWAAATGTSNWSFLWTPLPADGGYTVRARATDRSGNVSSVATRALIVDNTGPSITIAAPAAGALLRGTSVAVNGSASDAGTGVVRVELSSNGGATWTLATGTTAWTFVWTLPADGIRTLQARAQDGAGILSAVAARTFTVDNTAPVASLFQPTTGAALQGLAYTIAGSASDNLSGVQKVEVSTDGGASWSDAAGTGAWNFVWSLPADGPYSVRARAVDGTGNVQATPAGADVIVDNTRPVSSISQPADGAFLKGATTTVRGTASDALSGLDHVEVSTDGGSTWTPAAGSANWTFDWTLPADGTHRVLSRAVDRAGNFELSSGGVLVKVDNTAPNVAISSPAAGAFIKGGSFTINGTAGDAVTGLAKVEVSTDGGQTFALASGTSSWSFGWPLPADGAYTLVARATDGVGNEGTSAPRTVSIDNGNPSSVIQSPTANQTVNASPFTVSGIGFDQTSGIDRVEVSTDGGATWSIAAGTTAWTYAWVLPADGTYTLRSRAVDRAGNAEVPGAGKIVRVDRTRPTTTLQAPVNNAALRGTNAIVSGTAADNFTGLVSVEVSTDGGATWAAATGTDVWSYDWTLPADGNYNLVTRARDGAGNVEVPGAGITVQVDNTEANTTLTLPANGASVRGSSFTVTGGASDNLSGLVRVEVSTDGGSTWSIASGTASWSFTWALPGDGTYNLRLRATDRAGNVETTPASISVKVDNTAPAATLDAPANNAILTGTAASLSGTSSDALSGVASVEVSADGGATWSAATGTTAWSYAWSLPTDGTYLLKARAVDVAGNTGAPTAGTSVKVDNTRPTSTISSPAAGAVLSSASVTLSGNASDNLTGVVKVELSTDNGSTWANATGTNPWSFNWTTGASGTYTLRSRATDAAGNVENPGGGVTVQVDKDAPTSSFTDPVNGQVLSGSTFRIRGTANDAIAGVARVDVSTNGGASFVTASGAANWFYDWTLPADGSYTLQIRATDNVNNAQTAPLPQISVTVDNSGSTCSVQAPLDGSILKGASAALSGTSSDNISGVKKVQVSTDNGSTWNDAVGAPNWTFAWSLPVDGTYVLRCRAIDNANNTGPSSAGVTVKVDNTKPSCGISTPAAGAYVAGTSYNVQGVASDNLTGISQVEVSTNGGTSWGLAAGGGSWSFTWSFSASGNYTLRCRATDGAGNLETPGAGNSVTVDNTLPISNISAPAAGAVLRGASFTITGSASDNAAGIKRVEVSTNGGATWTTANGATSWTYAWTLPADGTYTLLSRAVDNVDNVETPGAGVTVKVDNTAPTPVISSPTDGQSINGVSFSINGTASDNLSGVALVQVWTENVGVWSDAAGTTSWSFSWSLPATDSPYQVKVRARDVAGNLSAETAITVKVDNTKPSSSITAPTAGQSLTGASFTITGTASDALAGVLRVEVSTDGGSTWTLASGTTAWTYNWSLPLLEGSYTLKSRATDRATNVETPGAGLTVIVDHTDPTCAVTSPANGAQVSGASRTISGTAADNMAGVKQVEVSTNGGISWTLAAGTTAWSYLWTLPADGNYTLRCRATDNANRLQNPPAGNAVTVDNTAPTSAITAPANGASISALAFTITGTASDNVGGTGLNRVEISTDDGASFATAAGTTSWSYPWTLPLTPGVYRLVSRGVDNAGALEPTAAKARISVNVLPRITSITTLAGIAASVVRGTAVRVNGDRFLAAQGASAVTFSGVNAGTALAWGANSLDVVIPYAASAGSNNVVVTVNGQGSPAFAFTVLAPVATITNLDTVCAHTSMALDSRGLPRIAYYDGGNGGRMKFARHDGASWTVSVVTDPSDNVGFYASLALDGADNPHIAYYDSSARDVLYIRSSTGGASWNAPQTVDATGNTGQWTSLRIDNLGFPYVAYYDDTNDNVRFARFNGTIWRGAVSATGPDTVSSLGGGATDAETSLALDSSGTPLIGFYNDNTQNVRRATLIAGAWVAGDVDECKRGNEPAVSAEIDAGNHVHVAYNFREVSKAAGRGASYVFDSDPPADFDGGLLVSNRTSIRVNRSGLPRVGFRDANGLRYAYLNPALGWGQDTLVSGSNANYVSLRLDDSGHARLSYCEGGSLRYFNYDTLR